MPRVVIPVLRLAGAALIGCLISTATEASPILVTGQVVVVSAPADARVNNVFENDTEARFFTERTNFLLPGVLTVNVTAAGVYSGILSGTSTIAAGTAIDSYYLMTDPVGTMGPGFTYSGSITFDTNILGIIVNGAQFATSNNVVGHPGTLYTGDDNARFEDQMTLSANLRTITFSAGSMPGADNLRIITAAAVPEPASLLLLGSGGLGLIAALRRRRKQRS